MTGATFVRADLHVHTFQDFDTAPSPDLGAYIASAVANDISVMAVTDHNTTRVVRQAMVAAEDSGLLLVPGVEVSTHDGHLLALFAPEAVDALDEFGSPGNLQLQTLSETEKRSDRSMLDLVREVHDKGGLAIPAHIDVKNGAGSKLSPAAMTELLCSPALAALEFATQEALEQWFTDDDPDESRRQAWKARQKIPELESRGLGRIMSSDAHSPDVVGRDRKSRTLTRLKLDEPNFVALRNAVSLNPKARCKAEQILPATYPRIISASFKGGFLDGVNLDFSENLNCLIGGRGSGKSTALLSIRACLGASVPSTEDVDDPDRMPERTEVHYLDTAGSERVAIRQRDSSPTDPDGAPIKVRLADLGQEETGHLSEGYEENPALLLKFLDGFVTAHEFEETDRDLQAKLKENESDVLRGAGSAKEIAELEKEQSRLQASLKAAETGKVEVVARYAAILAAQVPLLKDLRERIEAGARLPKDPTNFALESIALEYGVDLSTPAAKPFVEGEAGVQAELKKFEKRRQEIAEEANKDLTEAAAFALESLSAWESEQRSLEERLRAKQVELEQHGLKVQAGAIKAFGERLNKLATRLKAARETSAAHFAARKERSTSVDELHRNRANLLMARRATLKGVADNANRYSDDLTIRVSFDEASVDEEWRRWLSEKFGFRMPRVGRLARAVSPLEFAQAFLETGGRDKLLALKDENGSFFTEENLPETMTWSEIFALQVMRLPDRPKIEVQRKGETSPRAFNHLSAGQQRSVLLGLLLCAERSDSLILDQPEDHLDGQYIASSVVRHLEAAKEHRQIIMATHSANLVVLGDAELVIPLAVEGGKSKPQGAGSIDRPETREVVCDLLEGGEAAYKRRGRKYGYRFADD